MFKGCQLIAADGIIGPAVFCREFEAKAGEGATLTLSALGVFEVHLNGERVGQDVMAPGWQAYDHRIGIRTYTLSGLKAHNCLTVTVAPGWYAGLIRVGAANVKDFTTTVIAELVTDSGVRITTDSTWQIAHARYLLADIYDGVIYDARRRLRFRTGRVKRMRFDKRRFQDVGGVPIVEADTVYPVQLIRTPRGETVLDFGINLVGYPVLSLTAKRGERVRLSFAEILDKDGNFYNENYRTAKCLYDYTCCDGEQSFTPFGTFYGFRYVRIDEFPHEYQAGEITARVIHSELTQTGDIKSGHPLLNRLFDNVLRGQLGNYVDVPTDCPQRNERLGWTGDAEVFVRTATYNFNVLEFFRKWLTDMVLEQRESGRIPDTIPAVFWEQGEAGAARPFASAWADAITICPYEVYLTYGDRRILSLTHEAMKKYLDGILRTTEDPEGLLWLGYQPYGDWLGLDAPAGSYKGSSDDQIIASAFFARSTEIYVLSGEALGKDMRQERARYQQMRAAFIRRFEAKLSTQTECALALRFGLVEHTQAVTRRLVERIHAAGDKLQTGFVGTPHLLHALSENGEVELAYTLLLNTDFPSWLYPVTMGATTIWEHWDGIRPDGKLWSADMNSYNHYAYGAVMDWVYGTAGGIRPADGHAGYSRARIAPMPDPRLGTLTVTFDTAHGRIVSAWYYEGDTPHYRIVTPVPADIVIDGVTHSLPAGTYVF